MPAMLGAEVPELIGPLSSLQGWGCTKGSTRLGEGRSSLPWGIGMTSERCLELSDEGEIGVLE